MLIAKRVKNGATDVNHISVVVVAAYLILAWPRSAFSEPTAAPEYQPHLQLAPINLSHSVSGVVGYIYDRNGYESNVSRLQSLYVQVNLGVRVSSFIWQPWIALVQSNLLVGLNSAKTKSGSYPTETTGSTIINGDAALNLLHYSRFPFDARIFREDNRYNFSYVGTNINTQRTGYDLDQSYSSLRRTISGNAFFHSENITGQNISPTHRDQLNINLNITPSVKQSLKIYGSADNASQPTQGLSSSFDTITADHVYMPNSIFSVASLADLFKTNYSITQGSYPQQSDTKSFQFSSFGSLRPEKTPLTITSSVRLFKSDSNSNIITTPTLTSSDFNLGANYLFSQFIRMYGSFMAHDSLGTQTLNTDMGLSAGKLFRDITTIGGYKYTRSVNGQVSSNSSTVTDSTNQAFTERFQRLGLTLSHALDKRSEYDGAYLGKNLYQNLTMITGLGGRTASSNQIHSSSTISSINSGDSTISNLNTGGSLSWSRFEGKGRTGIRLNVNDARNLGGAGTQYNFQMVNLQASRSEILNRNESLQGNLTLQATRSQHDTGVYKTLAPDADVHYRNLRTFKVLNLVYDSILRIADSNLAATQLGQNQATRIWMNNFTYKIGRLDMRLDTSIAKNNHITQSSILLVMSRLF